MEVQLYKKNKTDYALRIDDFVTAILKIDEENHEIKLDKLLQESEGYEEGTYVVKEMYPNIQKDIISFTDDNFEIKQYDILVYSGETHQGVISEILILEDMRLHIMELHGQIYIGYTYLVEGKPKMTLQSITERTSISDLDLTFDINLDEDGSLLIDDLLTCNLMLIDSYGVALFDLIELENIEELNIICTYEDLPDFVHETYIESDNIFTEINNQLKIIYDKNNKLSLEELLEKCKIVLDDAFKINDNVNKVLGRILGRVKSDDKLVEELLDFFDIDLEELLGESDDLSDNCDDNVNDEDFNFNKPSINLSSNVIQFNPRNRGER